MPAATSLVSLPDELLLKIAHTLLSSHLPSSLRFCTTSKQLAASLGPCARKAEARRLRWDPSATGHIVTNEGRTITRLGGKWTRAWAYADPLPTTGRFSWRFRIDRCALNEGVMCVGLCDEEGRHAYGLSPYSGRLSSLCREKPGTIVVANSCPPPVHAQCSFTLHLMPGSPSNLKGHAVGALIEVIVDADAGTACIRVNHGPAIQAVAGFPAGVRLRPWARLFDVPDRVSMCPYWTPC